VVGVIVSLDVVNYRVLYVKFSQLISHLQCLNELRDERCNYVV